MNMGNAIFFLNGFEKSLNLKQKITLLVRSFALLAHNKNVSTFLCGDLRVLCVGSLGSLASSHIPKMNPIV